MNFHFVELKVNRRVTGEVRLHVDQIRENNISATRVARPRIQEYSKHC